MFYVYILLSKKDGQLYVGFTPDLKQRFKKHENGYVLATKNRRPLVLIYYEAYTSNTHAKRREKYLKGGKGRSELKIQLKECFKKMNYKYR
ncbi:MAG: GIY-YIG nuclease family protein [Patescibacteria group bacterium]